MQWWTYINDFRTIFRSWDCISKWKIRFFHIHIRFFRSDDKFTMQTNDCCIAAGRWVGVRFFFHSCRKLHSNIYCVNMYLNKISGYNCFNIFKLLLFDFIHLDIFHITADSITLHIVIVYLFYMVFPVIFFYKILRLTFVKSLQECL